jgi:7-cyano-7-deazaguanine synthase
MKTVLIYSGGLDSTVLLHELKAWNDLDCAVSVDYGQRHRRELEAAESICDELDVHHIVLPIRWFAKHVTHSSQTGATEPPEGHYADESMKVTVVPNRNMIMLSMAAAIAIDRGVPAIAYAAHAGDHTIYPDCRPAFIETMQRALTQCHFTPLTLRTPYSTISKAAIVQLGYMLHVPMHKSYSCYAGRPAHCGKCGTCTERREAFKLAGVEDLTEYE